MKQYKELVNNILKYGDKKDPARENMPATTSLFGYQNKYDLREGFPIITTKKINFKNIVTELLWFLKGDTNIRYLVDNGCNIWNEDAYNYYLKLCRKEGIVNIYSFKEFEETIKGKCSLSNTLPINYTIGECGKQYGWLWRNWGERYIPPLDPFSIDQFRLLISGLQTNPKSRRHIITAWNPETLEDMALNACHSFVQFNCSTIPGGDKEYGDNPQYYLDCQMYQRSADTFLGVPYNISSYCLLMEIVGKLVNMVPRYFVHSFGDVHIYDDHTNAITEQLKRECKPLPYLKISNKVTNLFTNVEDIISDLQVSDFELKNYESHLPIKGKLSTGLK